MIEVADRPLAKRGEGAVYRTNNPNLVAKVYHKWNSDRDQKLQIMLDNPPSDPTRHKGHVTIVWPVDLLTNDTGACPGFLMPFIEDAMTLRTVYVPALRKRKAAGFNWYFRGHNLKWTNDIGYAFNGVAPSWASSGTGWRPDGLGEDGQIVFRSQIQVLF